MICDKAFDDSLAELKLIPDWPVTSKVIIRTLYYLVRTWWFNLFDEYSADVTFCCNEMGILNVNLDNINLDDNFDEDDPDTIVVIRLLAWHSKFERHKTVNKR